jgi:hypothetical protein
VGVKTSLEKGAELRIVCISALTFALFSTFKRHTAHNGVCYLYCVVVGQKPMSL